MASHLKENALSERSESKGSSFLCVTMTSSSDVGCLHIALRRRFALHRSDK